ncbi:MAG TPA: tyrosine--tRNA ligase, partial [Pyrinomonadaceae bacterium]|nr:tyrosine--tRNA ligase [Pyrinomonadaceae bacterium]
RTLQQQEGQEGQCVLTTPLLEGLDGVQKMSKSLNNYIGIDELPDQMFGKVMSISDDLMWRYYELLTHMTVDDVNAIKFKVESGAEHPRDLKVTLAKAIITDFHSAQSADKAEEEFNRRFVQKEVPEEVEETNLPARNYKLPELLTATGLAASKGEAKRLIEQGGVRINGEKATSATADINLTHGSSYLLQVGKLKFLRVLGTKSGQTEN